MAETVVSHSLALSRCASRNPYRHHSLAATFTPAGLENRSVDNLFHSGGRWLNSFTAVVKKKKKKKNWGERQRERETKRQRDRDRQRQRERHRQRETERQRQTDRPGQSKKGRERAKERQADVG